MQRQITKVKPVMHETCCHANFNAYVLFHTLFLVTLPFLSKRGKGTNFKRGYNQFWSMCAPQVLRK